MTARQTSFLESTWIDCHDGNPTAMAIFQRHYTFRSNRKIFQFVGPGEKMVLLTPDASALFVWRKFIDDAIPKQTGVNCAAFRNEGSQISSFLIREAMESARLRWPGERVYTYVNPSLIRHKRDPGRCFIKTGWRPCGETKNGLTILESHLG